MAHEVLDFKKKSQSLECIYARSFRYIFRALALIISLSHSNLAGGVIFGVVRAHILLTRDCG